MIMDQLAPVIPCQLKYTLKNFIKIKHSIGFFNPSYFSHYHSHSIFGSKVCSKFNFLPNIDSLALEGSKIHISCLGVFIHIFKLKPDSRQALLQLLKEYYSLSWILLKMQNSVNPGQGHVADSGRSINMIRLYTVQKIYSKQDLSELYYLIDVIYMIYIVIEYFTYLHLEQNLVFEMYVIGNKLAFNVFVYYIPHLQDFKRYSYVVLGTFVSTWYYFITSKQQNIYLKVVHAVILNKDIIVYAFVT